MAESRFYRDVNNDNKWTIDKDPDAVLDYSLDWVDWLATGDSLATSAWAADTGLSVDVSPAPTIVGTVTTVWLSGGTAGSSYEVTNSITTDVPIPNGRSDDRSFVVKVVER
jgi:hypothetical protein